MLTRVKEVIEQVQLAKDVRVLTRVKKLRGHDSYFRIRLGDYRIGLEIVGDEAIFIRFLHRREVYKFFP